MKSLRTHYSAVVRIFLTTLAVFPIPVRAAQYIVGWGDNTYNQIAIPLGITNAVAVSSAAQSSLALKADGTLVAWGSMAPIPPFGLSNIAAIACGNMHCVALRSNGTVVAWGSNSFGQTNVPAGLSNVVAIAAGELHSLALLNNGSVVQWGYNAVVPAGLTNITSIGAGSYQSIVSKSDGSIVVWGYDLSFLPPPGLSNLTAFAKTTMALTSAGTVVSWGNNLDGQTNVPATLSNVVAISTSGTHELALQDDGTFVGWGRNSHGETILPVSLTNILSIAAGYNCSMVIVSKDDDSPIVITHPMNQTVNAGETLAFTSAAEGVPPPVCQWQFNGTNIPGATNRTLWVSNAVPANAGNYRAVFANISGTATSIVASLTVQAYPPVISYPLQNQSAVMGTKVILHLESGAYVSGSPPLSYQWLFNGDEIPGATNLQLVFNSVSTTNEGYYTLVAANPYGTNSSTAFLNILDLNEAMDNTNLVWTTSGDAFWVSTYNYDHNGYWSPMARSGAVTNNQSSTLRTMVTGPGKLTFWWKVSSQPGVDYLAWFSNGVEQARISGVSAAGSAGWSMQTAYFTAGTQTLQWVYTKDPSGFSGEDVGWLDYVTYTPGIFPPVITANPSNLNVPPGLNAAFSVQASGATPLSYQWEFEGVPIIGATNSSLTLTNVQFSNRGNYHVVVSNTYDSITSSNAFLNVFSFVGPPQTRDAIDRWYWRSPLQFTKVRYVGGCFVGLGANGLLATSPDGKSWTVQSTGTTYDLTGIAYGPLFWPPQNGFMVSAANGTLLWSTNLTSWTIRTVPYSNLRDVASDGAGDFVFVRTANSGEPNVLVVWQIQPLGWSGVTFDSLPGGSGSYYGDTIVSVGNSLIAAAGYGFAHDIWRSTDGYTWDQVGFSDQVVGGISAGDGRILMVGWESWPRVSLNSGATWSPCPSDVITSNAYQPPGYILPMVGSDVAFGNGTFLVARSFLQNGFLTTSDAVAWEKRSLFTAASIDSVAYGNGTFVVACSGGAYPVGVYQSESVVSPAIVLSYDPGSNNIILSISGEVGRNYRLQTSSNLTDWATLRSYLSVSPINQFVDTNGVNSPGLFYRVISP